MFSRLTTVIKSKINILLEKVEDPRQTLEYSYQKQQELLRNVKRGIAEVVTSRKRLELQKVKLDKQFTELDGQAKKALSIGREDLAKSALERKLALKQSLENLTVEISDLEKEQEKLITTEAKLSFDLERLRTHKEVVKAKYSAAEAQVKVTEAATGISDEITDIGTALGRVNEKTENMKAKAAALEEITDRGILDNILDEREPVQQEIDKISNSQHIQDDLDRLKKELEQQNIVLEK